MSIAKRLASLGLAALAAVALTSAGPAGFPGLPPADSGVLLGKWDLPAPGAPGKAHAAFVDEDGATRFVLDVALLPEPSPGSPAHGRIAGFVREQGDPSAPGEVVALVRGRYEAERPGKGVFRVVFLVEDASAEHGLRPVGGGKGTYLDPKPAQQGAPAGGLKGKWILLAGGGIPVSQR